MRVVVEGAIGRVGTGTLSVCTALLVAGCGSGGSTPSAQTPPPPPPMTAVTLVLSGTANDQLSEFQVSLQAISLTSASGNKVNLITHSPGRPAEFIHINGTNEPLLTAMVPQDRYTAATVTVGYAAFTCVTLNQYLGLDISTYAYGQTPTADVTVTLPSPIAVGAEPLGLSLNMLATQSASYGSCAPGSTGTPSAYAIAPTFSLSTFAFSSSRATADDGAVVGLNGQVTGLDGDSGGFQISLPAYALVSPATSVHVAIGSATAWQGVSALADLEIGSFVELDGALRSDGSVAATRVAVADPTALDVGSGPLLAAWNTEPVLQILSRQSLGKDLPAEVFNFSGTTFRVSGAFANLQSLPFTPSFTAQNMVAGQTVSITSSDVFSTGSYQATANTITLVPQTVNGTVTSVSTEGNFIVYSVSLASDDLFPALAAQGAQTTLLTTPSAIEVYTDTNTAMLTSSAPAAGDTLRFYGLVFNDNGTLRMDCAQVRAGVTALSH